MANENYPFKDMRELTERFEHIQKNNRPEIVRIVPYAKGSNQYIILVIQQSVYYEALTILKDKIIGNPIPATDINGLMRYIMEKDETFFKDLIDKAKRAIDQLDAK